MMHFLCVDNDGDVRFRCACTGEVSDAHDPDMTSRVSLVTCMTCKVAIDMLFERYVSAHVNKTLPGHARQAFEDQTVNFHDPKDGYPAEYQALVKFGFYNKPNTEVTHG